MKSEIIYLISVLDLNRDALFKHFTLYSYFTCDLTDAIRVIVGIAASLLFRG